jgi:Protein of unknown function (DUF3631)
VAKAQTPAQRFKHLFDLSNDESTTPAERAAAARKCREWLKRHDKKSRDISSILAQAERDDAAANPPSPPPPPPPNPFDDPTYNAATLVEEIVERYLVMRPHVRTLYVLWIVATHVHTEFRIAPRVLLISELPDSGKTTALEVARSLMFRANEESAATEAALRDHLAQGPGSIALDEGDLLDATGRKALLRLWNLGHVRGTKFGMMGGGRKKQVDLFGPVIAAGLGCILGQAQLTRAFVLRVYPYSAEEAPKFNWWAPADTGPDSPEARREALGLIYQYLRSRAAHWKLNRQPPLPPGVVRRSADNFRSLLAVADACGGDWPRRAREAAVTLISEMNAEQPKVLIVRHGLLLFDHFEADWLEIGHFNQELHRLSEPEFDWNRFRGASGLDMNPRPISISEQGRLLGAAGIKSHSMWPRGAPRSQRKRGDCQRVYRGAEFEAALRRAGSSSSPSSPVLRLTKRPAE